MGNPAPHVPVLFLKAGGSAFFSATCQRLLISAGLNPDAFGSYDAVSKKIRDAKTKIADWNAMTPAQQAANPGARPTAQDHFMANSTASHLIQDGAYRHARVPNANGTPATPPFPTNPPMNQPGAKGRGNPCASLVTGYTEGTAPCFAAEGSKGITGSMEQRIGTQEESQMSTQVTANGGASPSPYPAGTLRNDENTRTSTITNNQVSRFNAVQTDPNRGNNPSAALSGSGPNGQAATAAERAAFAQGVGANKPKRPSIPRSQIIHGQTAEECINAWRERAKGAMKSSGLDEEIARTQNEATPGAQAAALANHNTAQANATAAQANVATTAPGTPERARAEAAASAARLRAATAREAYERTQTASARLPCLQRMQTDLRAGNQNDDGRAFTP